MRILLINFSPRAQGNTDKLLRPMAKALQAQQPLIDCNQLALRDFQIKPCRGCRICFDGPEAACPCQDELLSLRDQLAAADAIVLASPVYVEDISGLCKQWIDRMAFHCYRPFLQGKPIGLLTTSGGRTSCQALRSLHMALTAWGGQVISRDNCCTGARITAQEAAQRFEPLVKRRAGVLLRHLRRPRLSLYTLTAFKTQQRIWRRSPEDHSLGHWQQQGWLAAERWHFSGIAAPWPKKKLAALLGAAVAGIMR